MARFISSFSSAFRALASASSLAAAAAASFCSRSSLATESLARCAKATRDATLRQSAKYQQEHKQVLAQVPPQVRC
jgi:hypothetical protein